RFGIFRRELLRCLVGDNRAVLILAREVDRAEAQLRLDRGGIDNDGGGVIRGGSGEIAFFPRDVTGMQQLRACLWARSRSLSRQDIGDLARDVAQRTAACGCGGAGRNDEKPTRDAAPKNIPKGETAG